MNRERLTHLITVLEGVPKKAFDIWLFRNECGTAACAVGWAGMDPVFQAQGFRLEVNAYGGYPVFENHGAWTSIEVFFDLPAEVAKYLFSGYEYSVLEPTPQHVIYRIKEVLANGH